MRKAPQLIIIAILVMAIGAAAIWFTAATATEKVLAGWVEDRREEGWTASYDAINTAGFPNRLDTTITNLTLSDPDTGIAWSAPMFQNLSVIYKPTHVIAVLPPDQTFATREATHRILSERFIASAVFRPALELPIERSVIEIDAATLETAGHATTIDHAVIAIRETPARTGHVYDFDIKANGIRPDNDLLARSSTLSDVIERVQGTATIRFDEPWDRYAIERARPQPREIELTKIAAQWGELQLDMTGVLVVGATGIPEGSIDLRAKNWRAMIALARDTGQISDTLANAIAQAATLIARMSGTPETLDAVLRFENGRAFLGPLPIGVAPKIQLP